MCIRDSSTAAARPHGPATAAPAGPSPAWVRGVRRAAGQTPPPIALRCPARPHPSAHAAAHTALGAYRRERCGERGRSWVWPPGQPQGWGRQEAARKSVHGSGANPARAVGHEPVKHRQAAKRVIIIKSAPSAINSSISSYQKCSNRHTPYRQGLPHPHNGPPLPPLIGTAPPP